MPKATVIVGDVRTRLAEIPDGSVRTCITSPPYFGLRDYGVDGQIGLEQTPDDYVAELVEVFREVRRVLSDDGTLWLNLGDSYAGSGKGDAGDTSTQTVGWEATCDCDAEIVPDVVLDPFTGSGTVAVVALLHGRNFIGIELNPEYANIAQHRIKDANPLFNEVEVVK